MPRTDFSVPAACSDPKSTLPVESRTPTSTDWLKVNRMVRDFSSTGGASEGGAKEVAVAGAVAGVSAGVMEVDGGETGAEEAGGAWAGAGGAGTVAGTGSEAGGATVAGFVAGAEDEGATELTDGTMGA